MSFISRSDMICKYAITDIGWRTVAKFSNNTKSTKNTWASARQMALFKNVAFVIRQESPILLQPGKNNGLMDEIKYIIKHLNCSHILIAVESFCMWQQLC